MTLNSALSLLEVFVAAARNPCTADRAVLECGPHQWTYAQLDMVSTAMTGELAEVLGSSPKVASVVENHPYIFALMLAVWKLDGTFIPIDAHVPSVLLAGMLNLVKPACIVLVASDVSYKACAEALNLRIITFDPEHSTIPALNHKYATNNVPYAGRQLPKPDNCCLYLFTSSPTSVENLKAVPLTHKFVLNNCHAKLAWWRRMGPTRELDGVRVLGWAPWSHVLSHMQDIGTATLLNAGCYVFAAVPNTYPIARSSPAPPDLTSLVIDAILHKNVQAFACVPLVLSGLKAACQGTSPTNVALLCSLRHMIMLECGGAMVERAACDWAAENSVPLVVGIGMTETGGAIFAGPAEDAFTGFSSKGLVPDAELSLIGDMPEGELVVKSKSIPDGYINYDDGSFAVDEDGWVTFRTGDRCRRTDDGKFVWVGRKTDFIQMAGGENLDPRPIENALCASSLIRNACVIGDTFLHGPATTLCAIIELQAHTDTQEAKVAVARLLAPINRDLPPAVRIAWSSILILDNSAKIPVTKKGEIFRKKIEGMFGADIATMLATPLYPEPIGQVDDAIVQIVGSILGVSDADMLTSMTFAELGMTSLSAVRIASALNKYLDGTNVLPPNICYIHLDLPSLIDAVVLTAAPHLPRRITSRISIPHQKDEIVLVGKAFRLPGAIDNDTALWDALLGKNDSIIADIPPHRWDHASFYPQDISFSRAGLLDVASYDYSFFGLTATEAFYVSPTMRLALEVAFEALENANIPVSKLKGSNAGIYVATKDDGFETLLNAAYGYEAYTRFYGTGRAPSTASGRISYLLDIHGPSITVDTACSGGIVCIDQAVTYLQSGAGEVAIVCSSNTHCWPGSFMFLTAQGMTSPNSRCAAFTSEADGYVPSEGAVAFILKTRTAAIRDKDCILATIKGTEVLHNGRSQGLAAPNMKSQVALHRALLHKAKFDPAHVDFIEAHGTGTSLGDLCEIQGINEAFTSSKMDRTHPLIIGASKSVLGHTECSAGLVGILSVLHSFKQGIVPGLAHLRDDNMNPALDYTAVPLLIPGKPVKLPGDGPRKALVMSYGFSGTLAEIALESPASPVRSASVSPVHTGPMIFAVSAKTSAALESYLSVYLLFLRDANASTFHKICYTTCVGREHHSHRFACVATDLSDLIAQVEHRVSSAGQPRRTRGSLAFAFPGQGTHFHGMAATLARAYSRFHALVIEFGRQAHTLCGAPIDAILLGETSEPEAHIRSETDQICIFVFQYSVCRWLNELGIEARSVIGHSLGEITAAVIAGGLTFEVGLDLVVTRARLLRPCPENLGGMAAMACSEAKAAQFLDFEADNFSEPITISVINGPQSVAVSGIARDIDTLVEIAKTHNIKVTRLHVDQGFHSARIDSAIPGLRTWEIDNSASFSPLRLNLYSTSLGAPVLRGQRLGAGHWVDHARQPVLFSQAATVMERDPSIGAILDIGPQKVAWSLLLSNGHSASTTLAFSTRKGDDQEIAVLTALAALFQNHGITPDFSLLYSQRASFETTQIPTYPFQRVHRYPSYVPSRRRSAFDRPVPSADETNVSAPQPGPSVAAERTKMHAEKLRASLMKCVRDVLEIRLGEELDDSQPLGLLGVDSIMFAQLRSRVERLYGLNVSVVFWSDAFSIADMINNLVEQYAERG
ncbi:hypothetical protein C8R44DRAFT_989127 [Mycena epipterygia]|nr:hypothetical protein C8R44DRAFT_989127 [Mycena epipterygia]